jgi:hypothetical protein
VSSRYRDNVRYMWVFNAVYKALKDEISFEATVGDVNKIATKVYRELRYKKKLVKK